MKVFDDGITVALETFAASGTGCSMEDLPTFTNVASSCITNFPDTVNPAAAQRLAGVNFY
jgi:hypothetical protein